MRKTTPKRKRPRRIRRIYKCSLCLQNIKAVDYKDVRILRRFLSPRGRIRARSKTGTCAKHQRKLSIAIKKARIMALLPFISR